MPKGKKPQRMLQVEDEGDEVVLTDVAEKSKSTEKRKRNDNKQAEKTQKSDNDQSASEVADKQRLKEEALKKAEEEKHQLALTYLKEHAHTNWIPLVGDLGDGRWIHNLFTSVPTDMIFVKQQGEGKDAFLQARYWKDSDGKKHFGLTRWSPPVRVTMSISSGHGSYNPENKFSDEYYKAKYVVFASDEMTSGFEEDLDKDWKPKSEDDKLPHELWKEAITGFFEDLFEKQERLIDQMYYSDVAENKRNEYIKQYTRTIDLRMKNNDRYKDVTKDSEEYKKIIDESAKDAFSAAAYRFVTKGDNGLYELRVKRPVFTKMTKKQKTQWKMLLAQLKKSGNSIEASEEHKPFFKFLERQPLQVADIHGNMLPRPRNYKTPQVLKGMYCMLKMSLNPFVQDQNHGVTARFARWPGEPEIIIYRNSEAEEGQRMALPQFKAAETVKPSYQVQEPDEDNSSDTWLKKLTYMMEVQSKQKQIDA